MNRVTGAQSRPSSDGSTAVPHFRPGLQGEFTFDTGVLRGKLRAQGKSLGLTEVEHLPSRTRLDRSNGLLSHYRVFSKGVRYGGGAWDWPSQASLLPNGTVVVEWARAKGRPFTMKAAYSWVAPDTIDLETSVEAHQRLEGFESFLASYASEHFTNAWACVQSDSGQSSNRFIEASPTLGDWLTFPRDSAAIALYEDGRWLLPPNPVSWKMQSRLARPLAIRFAPHQNLAILVMGQASTCFAVSMPHEMEGHYSTYLSLYGRTLEPGQVIRAKTRLMVRTGLPLAEAEPLYLKFAPLAETVLPK